MRNLNSALSKPQRRLAGFNRKPLRNQDYKPSLGGKLKI